LLACHESEGLKIDTLTILDSALQQATHHRLVEASVLFNSNQHYVRLTKSKTAHGTASVLTSAAKHMSALNCKMPSVGLSGKGLMISPDTITTTLQTNN
jgi:hypothetical protein